MRTLFPLGLAVAVVASACLFNRPTAHADVPAPTIAQLAEKLDRLEKRIKFLETVAYTPPALHAYLQKQAKNLAGDNSGALVAAIKKAEKATTRQEKIEAYVEAKKIIEGHNKVIGKTCPSYCGDELDQCNAAPDSDPTVCFAQYIACCKG